MFGYSLQASGLLLGLVLVHTPTLVLSSSPEFSLFPSLVFYTVLGFSLLPTLGNYSHPLVFHLAIIPPWACICQVRV